MKRKIKPMKTEDEGGKVKTKKPKKKNDEKDLDAMLEEIEREEAHGKDGAEESEEDVPF